MNSDQQVQRTFQWFTDFFLSCELWFARWFVGTSKLTLFSLKFSSNCQHSSSILSFDAFSFSSSSSSSQPESFGHSQHSPSEGDPLELELEPGSVPESSSPPDNKHFFSDFARSLRFFVHRRGSSRIMTSSSSLRGSPSCTRLGHARGDGTEDDKTSGFDWSICTSTEFVFLFKFSISFVRSAKLFWNFFNLSLLQSFVRRAF